MTEADIDQGVQVKLTAGTSDKVLFASKRENKVQVKASAILYGNLIVPAAEVHFETGSKIKGAVLANSISLDAKVCPPFFELVPGTSFHSFSTGPRFAVRARSRPIQTGLASSSPEPR